MQIIFMTPAAEIFHASSGFLPPGDLLAGIQFAGQLFEAIKDQPANANQLTVQLHQKRLESHGFNAEEIDRNDPGMFGLAPPFAFGPIVGNGTEQNFVGSIQNGSPSLTTGHHARRLLHDMSRRQFLADNRFSIRNPLMRYDQFERDPSPLVGAGTSFFASESSNSDSC